jgi:hypothetical protein
MPYAVSSHRKRLNQQLDEIKKNLRIADGKGIPSVLRDYAIAAAIFLAHAEIENYFVDSLSGIANAYSKALADASKLPIRLRAHLVVEKLNFQNVAAKLSMKSGEGDVHGAVEKWFSSPQFALLNESKPLPAFFGSDIHGDYSYPSKKNIERILRRIGIGDPKGTLNGMGKRDVLSLLESVADLRTALAHSAALPGIACTDVIQRLSDLKLFAQAMDRVLYAHVRASLTHAAWRADLC